MKDLSLALILIGVGLFVHGFWAVLPVEVRIMGTERLYGQVLAARLEAAIGAALAIGGLLHRARK